MNVVELHTRNALAPDRDTLAKYLRLCAADVESGEVDAERIYVVYELVDGQVVLDITGSAGATNAHAVGIFHVAAQKVMQP